MAGRMWLSIAVVGLASLSARAQTIQLPVFHTFSTATTVVVPDSGSGFLAGSSSGGFDAAPFGGVGSMTAAGGLGAIAQIHDLPALDAQLLGANLAAQADPWGGKLAAARANLTSAGGQSIAEIRRELAAQDAAQQAQWVDSFERGRRALAEGKPGVAKIYFQSVARHATGPLQEQAQAQLKALASQPAAPKQR
jgi:hypothetical protein